MQAVAGNIPPDDVKGWKRWCDTFIIHDTVAELAHADPEIPLVGGLNLAQREFREWMGQRRPFICFNRPHLGGWANARRLGVRRASVNSYACTSFGKKTHNRWRVLDLPRHPWKVKSVRKVLIAPPQKTTWYCLGQGADEWANDQATWFQNQGAEVRVRHKTVGKGKKGRYVTLFTDLDWTDLVVSYTSAITTEAFWYGKKVISPGVCSTWPCGSQSRDNWQDPTEPPHRDLWHEHAAWTQFTAEEWSSGEAQEMIIAYQGHPLEVEPPDNPIKV